MCLLCLSISLRTQPCQTIFGVIYGYELVMAMSSVFYKVLNERDHNFDFISNSPEIRNLQKNLPQITTKKAL